MVECNIVSIPIDKSILSINSETNIMLNDRVPYSETVGSLLYLVTETRLEISYADSAVSQVRNKPTKRH